MAERSKEFWLVGFYLAKYGNSQLGKETAPPNELNTQIWKEAYNIFYAKLGEGRSASSFENSLKNCRDAFDSHIKNSRREGWKDLNRKPIKLPKLALSILKKYDSLSRDLIWDTINAMLSSSKRKTNPDWTREELVLALDLYFNLDQGQMHKDNPDVIRVSNELRSLNIHKEIPDPKKFRNPSGISRRLGNFKNMDSNYIGEGLSNSGKLAKEIFIEFSQHRDKLRNEAGLIKQLYIKPETGNKLIAEEERYNYKSEFLFNFHKNRETDPLINKIKKEMVLLTSSSLKCEVCGFDSVAFFGEFGNDLLEIHYTKELKSEPGLEQSSMEDFIIVCSNCHKVLDSKYGIINANDLRFIIRKK
jgi:5-methylcytosine-specific restriction enzyme A